jgi:hypothetical protein
MEGRRAGELSCGAGTRIALFEAPFFLTSQVIGSPRGLRQISVVNQDIEI